MPSNNRSFLQGSRFAPAGYPSDENTSENSDVQYPPGAGDNLVVFAALRLIQVSGRACGRASFRARCRELAWFARPPQGAVGLTPGVLLATGIGDGAGVAVAMRGSWFKNAMTLFSEA